MLHIDVITLFPEHWRGRWARRCWAGDKRAALDIRIINLRDFAFDKHRTVDDTRFGGGADGLQTGTAGGGARQLGIDYDHFDRGKGRLLLTAASGKVFDHSTAVQLSLLERLVVICGHYKGVDERILQLYPIDEVSVGDFVLTGGEPAAWVIIDAVLRLIPGVMGISSRRG